MTTLSDRVIYRRTAPVIMVITFVLAIGATVGTYVNDRNDRGRDRARITDNAANVVTNCQNANESRDASRTLWYFVVDLASKDAAPREVAYLAEVREWIGQVYQPHDCDDLARKYVIPPPPRLPGR